MKLLHTSDWHLGRMLYSKKERQAEHTAFLEWLLHAIIENNIDLLIVAGDIFDSASPSSASQKMYYDFLLRVHHSGCNNVVVVGGNHDSPSFLNAPKDLLAVFNVSVIGKASENVEEEIVVVTDSDNEPGAIVCAVPFLREREIGRFTEGESYADRSKRIAENIKRHYEKLAELAEDKRKTIGKNIPVIATGHLSVAGGKTTEDDGVRETYIGNIECVGNEIFPEILDYVALGHYHIPSAISERIRYCGSPIPMGFGEIKRQKCVYIVDFEKNKPAIVPFKVPVFQKMESIRGSKDFIEQRLSELKKSDISVWVEIIYDGKEIFPDFTAWVNGQTTNTSIEILKLQNRRYFTEVLTQNDSARSLDELDKNTIFDKLLEKNSISEEQKPVLKELYNEIVVELNVEY